MNRVQKDFALFKKVLSGEARKDLPGVKAHKLLLPFRKDTVDMKADDPRLNHTSPPKESAVMALFYPHPVDGTPSFCLTERHKYKGTHSGQICFPGGKMDDEDDSLQQTAFRELWEEVGIREKHVTMVTPLTKLYIPPSNFFVTPFLGFCDAAPDFALELREVAAVLDVHVHMLMDDSLLKETTMKFADGRFYTAPYFDIHERVVWGATAAILAEIKMMLIRHQKATI